MSWWVRIGAASATLVAGSAFAQPDPELPSWQYGAFVDGAYLHDFNEPENHLFRSRGTTSHVDELDLNMAGAYLRKPTSDVSRWGTELTVHGGNDSEVFGYSATAPNLGGSTWLRHLGPTDVSYLAPIGNGLTIQGGIFTSLIGYDSLYAKDNLNYTRPWGADFTPYLMLGVNASYPLTDKLTGTACVISGYWHLAHANDVPSSCVQLAYKLEDHLTAKQTVLYGPHQADTSLPYWRFLEDSIVEYKDDIWTTVFELYFGTEIVAAPGDPRAVWLAAQLPIHRVVTPRLSVTVRPELFWDRDGRTTGFRQTVMANTTTLDYRVPYHDATAIFRLEYRIDDSRGADGGLFYDGEVQPGVDKLKSTQQLIGVAAIVTFDSSFRP